MQFPLLRFRETIALHRGAFLSKRQNLELGSCWETSAACRVNAACALPGINSGARQCYRADPIRTECQAILATGKERNLCTIQLRLRMLLSKSRSRARNTRFLRLVERAIPKLAA